MGQFPFLIAARVRNTVVKYSKNGCDPSLPPLPRLRHLGRRKNTRGDKPCRQPIEGSRCGSKAPQVVFGALLFLREVTCQSDSLRVQHRPRYDDLRSRQVRRRRRRRRHRRHNFPQRSRFLHRRC